MMDVAPRHPERIAAARMAIINHDRIKAELLHFYCSTHWGFAVVAMELNGHDGLAAVERTKPDLLLLSLSLPDTDAANLIQAVRARAPATRIIGQTVHCTDYLLHRLNGSEYHGLILDTEETLGSLALAIQRVRQGSRAVSPRLIRDQMALRNAPASFPKLLSRREEQVLVCIAHALTDDEIGLQLGFSAITALSHRKKIMRKLGFHSTPKLIRYCSDHGFNSVPPASIETRTSP
jgi:two-component system nitrate/nitrite response regulator NarL